MNQIAACYLPPIISLKNIFKRRRGVRRGIYGVAILLLLLCYSIAKSVFNESEILLILAPQLNVSLSVGNFFVSFMAASVRSSTVLFLSQDSSILLKAPLSQGKLFIFRFLQIFVGTQWSMWLLLAPFFLGLILGSDNLTTPINIAVNTVLAQISGTALALLLVTIAAGISPVNRFREGTMAILVLILLAISTFSFYSEFLPNAKSLSSMSVTTLLTKIKSAPSLTTVAKFWSLTSLIALLSSGIFFSRNYQKALSRLSDHRREATRISISFPRLIPIPGSMRANASKEFRLFLRNPSQVLQLLIFLGGVLMYLIQAKSIGNITSIPDGALPYWDSGKALIHSFVSGMLLCGMCSRFVFPSFSLEGGSIWIYQAAPISAKSLLKQRITIWSGLLLSVGLVLLLAIGFALSISIEGLMWNVFTFCLLVPILVTIASVCGALFVRFDWEHPGAVTGGWGSLLTFIICSCVAIAITAASVSLLVFNFVELPNFNKLNTELTIQGIIILSITSLSLLLINKAQKIGVESIASFGEVKALRKGKYLKNLKKN